MDWDLKRDIAKKLDKLERRTQKAIVEIVRKSPLLYVSVPDCITYMYISDCTRSAFF